MKKLSNRSIRRIVKATNTVITQVSVIIVVDQIAEKLLDMTQLNPVGQAAAKFGVYLIGRKLSQDISDYWWNKSCLPLLDTIVPEKIGDEDKEDDWMKIL